jgi:UDP-N-acetylglucosamine diphosphorylase/glucosamine-1-phosphate N-acetyltransferase
MSRLLLLYEDAGWRSLRPLTELVPVPALAFGDSHLAARWRRAAGLPLLGIEAREDALRAWDEAPVPETVSPAEGDHVLVINAAAVPGAWLDGALAAGTPALFQAGERVAGALVPYATLRPGVSRGAEFEAFLLGLELPRAGVDARFIAHPWNLIEWNAETLAEDLARGTAGIRGDVHSQAVLLEPARITVEAGARVDPLAVLDARGGPIRIEPRAVVFPHTVVVGPCLVGAGTQLLGGFVSRSTIGPACRIAGEVEECIWQGHASKRHHGFVGHSVIGEWVNLGALTTTSDLKNNYGSVRVWVDRRRLDSGITKIGSLIGPHVKTGIGTLLPTGASIGTGCNLFGGGRFAPAYLAPFSWWNGESVVEHRLEPFLATARVAISRRERTLTSAGEVALRRLFESTAAERREQVRLLAAAGAG